MMNVIAMYLRLSNEDEGSKEESNSIGNQRILIKEYIRKHFGASQYSVKEYCDDGYSGTNFERPGIKELLEDVKKQRIQCIVVKDLSRFCRDYIELGTYLNQIFPFMGVRFIAINDNYDSDSHEGNTIEMDTAFKTLVYDLYSKDLSIKMKAVYQSKCENGEYIFGQTPYGYVKSKEERNQILIREEEAEVIREIFMMKAAGESNKKIARYLQERNIPTWTQLRRKTNNSDKVISWNPSSITRIVSNRVYLGEMIYGKRSTNIAGNSSIIRHPQEEWKVIKNHHEAIVSEELFEQANKMLHGPKKRDTSKKKHVLVGKMICGGCGYALSFKPKASYCKYSCFECSRHSLLKIPECCTHFKADILEEIVLKRLNQELMIWGDSYQQAGNMEAHYESVLRSLKEELRINKLELESVQAAKKSLYESYALSDMTAEEYKEQSGSLTRQVESLQEKLGELQEKISAIEQEYDVKKEDMKKIIRYSHMEELTEEIVDTFIKRIYLYHDKSVEIEWTFGERIL